MAISKQAVQAFTGDYQSVFGAVCAALQAERMQILSADPATGVINASGSMSWISWGENIVIGVGADPAGTVSVSLRSKLKFGLVDWGKNQQNINRLFGRIGAFVQNPAMIQAQAAQAGAWHPDPHGRHELRYWDGTVWTDHVSDDGQVSTDPVGA